MTASFPERWREKELENGLEAVPSRMVPIGTDLLPDSAAPCLDFDRAASPSQIYKIFASESDWSSSDRERLDRYLAIGSDGAGNPVCVDTTTGAVVLLDHEDCFHTMQFVNSGIKQLGECLLAYLGETDGDRFRAAVSSIDPAALEQDAFWWHEAACLGSAT